MRILRKIQLDFKYFWSFTIGTVTRNNLKKNIFSYNNRLTTPDHK